jgi:hypothetical protein
METATEPISDHPPGDSYRKPRWQLIAEIRRLRSRIAVQDTEIFELQHELLPLLESTGRAIAELRQQIAQTTKPSK